MRCGDRPKQYFPFHGESHHQLLDACGGVLPSSQAPGRHHTSLPALGEVTHRSFLPLRQVISRTKVPSRGGTRETMMPCMLAMMLSLRPQQQTRPAHARAPLRDVRAVASGASLPDSSWRPVFVDHVLLVVDKDAGLLTVPGKGAQKSDCLLSRVWAAGYTEIKHAPHRLDRDTSGLVVLGRSPQAHRALAMAFQERHVNKTYEALVLGWPVDDDGIVDAPIGKLRAGGESYSRMSVVPPHVCNARMSVTQWRVVERVTSTDGSPVSRMQLTPITGRAHQLRLHMSHIGHPILGDELHGTVDATIASPRLCLHAKELTIHHPDDGKPITFKCHCPF